MNDAQGQAAKPAEPDKPLNQTQVRNLTKLVQNDYQQAFRDLDRQYGEALRRKRDEINTEFGLRANEVRQIEAEVMELNADLKARWIALKDELAERGFEPRSDAATQGNIHLPGVWQVAGHQTELRKAEDELNRAYTAARHALATAQAGAERQILLASITSEAAQRVLETIPKAADLFRDTMGDPTSIEGVEVDSTEIYQAQRRAGIYPSGIQGGRY